MKTTLRIIAFTILSLSVVAPATAQTQSKRLIRVHTTAGPADLGVDTTDAGNEIHGKRERSFKHHRGQGIPEQPARAVT